MSPYKNEFVLLRGAGDFHHQFLTTTNNIQLSEQQQQQQQFIKSFICNGQETKFGQRSGL